MRIITAIMGSINTALGATYYTGLPCYVVDFLFKSNETRVLDSYPNCKLFYDGTDPKQHVLVTADTGSEGVDHVVAGFFAGFGAGGWLALAIHVIGVELYLHLTPAEGERLRRISYQRQLEAGMRNPGNAGLTVQRLGDAEPWIPPTDSVTEVVQRRKGSGSDDRESNDVSL